MYEPVPTFRPKPEDVAQYFSWVKQNAIRLGVTPDDLGEMGLPTTKESYPVWRKQFAEGFSANEEMDHARWPGEEDDEDGGDAESEGMPPAGLRVHRAAGGQRTVRYLRDTGVPQGHSGVPDQHATGLASCHEEVFGVHERVGDAMAASQRPNHGNSLLDFITGDGRR